MSDNVDKPEDQNSASSPETPVVEAEIVTDEDLVVDSVADSGGAFDDTNDAVTPARKSTLTLGVIFFILFAVAAVVVFAVWRFQSGPATPDLAAAAQAESIIETPQTVAEETTVVMAEETSLAPEPDDPPATDIGNITPPLTSADASDDIDLQGDGLGTAIEPQISDSSSEGVASDALIAGNDQSPTDDSAAGETNAPDVMSAGDADDLIPETALDSIDPVSDAEAEAQLSPLGDELSDDENAEIANVDIASPDPINGDLEALAEQNEAPIAMPDTTETDAAQSEAAIPDTVTSADLQSSDVMLATPKIDNEDVQQIKESFTAEIARLEAALAAEQAQNATQREQIEEMRRNFQAALAARDRSANQQIMALNDRLDKIENGNDVQGGRRAAAALALNNLRRVAEQGEPFANELDVLAGYLPQGGEIATLRQYSNVEIPMKDELETAFSVAAREALAAAGREEKTGLGDKLSARITSLVSVRPAEPIEGTSARAIISRAEAFIEAGDISAGANELRALVDGPSAAMADWLALAQSRIAVDGAIASLSARLAAPVR